MGGEVNKEVMQLERMQGELRRLILNLRSVEAVIYKPMFKRLFDASTDKQKEEIKGYFLKGERYKVANWMLMHPDVELGELSANKLKELAKRSGVPGYSRLDRTELALEIERHRECKQKKS